MTKVTKEERQAARLAAKLAYKLELMDHITYYQDMRKNQRRLKFERIDERAATRSKFNYSGPYI